MYKSILVSFLGVFNLICMFGTTVNKDECQHIVKLQLLGSALLIGVISTL